MWHALAGPQACFASGEGRARRYARGFSPILGFEDPARPDFDALLPHCEPGEHFYCADWAGAAPPGWHVEVESKMVQMVWRGALPDAVDAVGITQLQSAHADAALELATLTRPGPFGPRTPELGEYFGVFEDGRLVAMAGERMQATGLREISGVCTHPQFQGRGLARRLMLHLMRRQMQRGETPFLHVMSDNATARTLYTRMGFDTYRECVVRVVART